jgi:putative endonuclease
MDDRRAVGESGENAAVDYLQEKGYHILRRNYRYQRGEIDIIAEEGDDLVFIEVKARRSKSYGDPEDGLNPEKCRRIKRVASGYLFEHRIDDRPCRFDIVAIEYEGKKMLLRHLKDAF